MPIGRVPVEYSKELLDMYDEGYARGFRDGQRSLYEGGPYMGREPISELKPQGSKRKLSAWQKYIKNKRNHIYYRDGKLNLKAMGVQYRKKKRK